MTSSSQKGPPPLPPACLPESAVAGFGIETTAAVARRVRLDVEAILGSIGETVYAWDLRSDQITWHPNTAVLLKVRSTAGISSGTAFHLHIGTEHAGARYALIRGSSLTDSGEGCPYRMTYRFLPAGRRSDVALWIEDQGRWFAGPDGRPLVAKGAVRVIDERHHEEQQLRYLSERDELTGLLNASRLSSAIDSAIAEVRASGRSCALFLVAINNMAIINDTFGFEIGDQVIAAIGRRLEGQLRGGDAIGRFGTNKFATLINDCETEGIQAVARRLLAAIRQRTVTTTVCEISASIAIGAVQVPLHAETKDEALAAALDALSEARRVRQDRCVVYSPATGRTSTRRRNIELADNIIAALEEHRMKVALQPIVRTTTNEVAFHECLLRMETRDGQLMSAGQFIAVAEQLGLARLIDQRVLELAVALVRKEPRLKLSFNVSASTASNHDWLVSFDRLTAGDRTLTRRLIVEITETMAISDANEASSFVDALKELGCRVAIDDFGAGYTSFKNLRTLGADLVKIDGSFVQNMVQDQANRAFVETLIKLATGFGMETVAEWVGDEATAEFLRSTGVTYMQGFHFGTPQMPIDVATIEV